MLVNSLTIHIIPFYWITHSHMCVEFYFNVIDIYCQVEYVH